MYYRKDWISSFSCLFTSKIAISNSLLLANYVDFDLNTHIYEKFWITTRMLLHIHNNALIKIMFYIVSLIMKNEW